MSIPREARASAALAQESRFRGEYPVRSASRLRELLASGADNEVLQVDLQVDAQSGWPRLHGSVVGGMALECRRCGKSYRQDVDLALDLRLVSSDAEERALLSQADPYRIEDDRLALYELIEDEVLLALPMLPRCESCENAAQSAVPPAQEQPVQEQVAKRENPFAALKQKLKTNQE